MSDTQDRLVALLTDYLGDDAWLPAEISMRLAISLVDVLITAGAVLPKYKLGRQVYINHEYRPAVPAAIKHIHINEGGIAYTLTNGCIRKEMFVYATEAEALAAATEESKRKNGAITWF